MKIAELSTRSGTSIPSIKFYLREGLLAPGDPTGRNQAEYGESHVHRLRLIRALIDVGGLTVAAARDVLAAVDAADQGGHDLLGVAHASLHRAARHDPSSAEWLAARADVLALVRRQGWYVPDESTGIDQAADAVLAMRALGQEDLLVALETYATAATSVAAVEVGAVVARSDPARMVEGVIVGTILGETLLNAFRRLAQQDASARLLLTPEQRAQEPVEH